jgi:uncharacterized protein (DUF488 family)
LHPHEEKNDQKIQRVFFTIGHSNRTIEAFLELLEAYGIKAVVDVRTIPKSTHNPQFGKEALSRSLAENNIRYLHMPELGGLRRPRRDSQNTGWRNLSFRGYADYMQTSEFDSGLEKFIEVAADEKTALMCAEVLPWRCHRSLIADVLVARGFEVIEIIDANSSRKHLLAPWAKVSGTKVTYPG